MKHLSSLFLAAILIVSACSPDSGVAYDDTLYGYQPPSNFPEMAYDTSHNPITQKGFELGKKIFYEGRLASDGVVSCGFCHMQKNAFTHHGHTFSHGVGDQIGTRNTPPVQNMAFQTQYMWDGAADHLELMPMIPILSEIEMNGSFIDIVSMMKSDPEYQDSFQEAFENGEINAENTLKALAQFMTVLTSANSKFDKYRRNEDGISLSEQEMRGYQSFNQKCAQCHATDIFTDNSFRNNGLPLDPRINDMGRYRVTDRADDKFKFKVPSLRNIEETAPYMHDGRFSTLEAVLDYYQNGVTDTENLDPILSQNGQLGIDLSEQEKEDIIVFLKTLTDTEFLNNPDFAEY